MAVVETGRAGAIAVVTMARPPVNALGADLRRELFKAVDALDADPAVTAIVVHGRGRGFSAGGDIREFGTPGATAWPGLSSDLHPRIEACCKPVIAAIHGLCLGGGLETALACHWRVATADAHLGLPEVKVGLLPLSGTQRLPRLLGLVESARLISEAQIVPASWMSGAFDLMVEEGGEDAALQAAISLATSLPGGTPADRLVRFRPAPAAGRDVVNSARERASDPVVRCALDAILAAADAPDFDTGIARARALYDALLCSEESLARQRQFPTRTNSR